MVACCSPTFLYSFFVRDFSWGGFVRSVSTKNACFPCESKTFNVLLQLSTSESPLELMLNCHRDGWRFGRCRTLLFPGLWTTRRHRLPFGLFSVRLKIKHHEHADYDEQRT